jgi:hypothetical protein
VIVYIFGLFSGFVYIFGRALLKRGCVHRPSLIRLHGVSLALLLSNLRISKQCMLNHAFGPPESFANPPLTPPRTQSQGLRASLIQPYSPPLWPPDHTTTATGLLSYLHTHQTPNYLNYPRDASSTCFPRQLLSNDAKLLPSQPPPPTLRRTSFPKPFHY